MPLFALRTQDTAERTVISLPAAFCAQARMVEAAMALATSPA